MKFVLHSHLNSIYTNSEDAIQIKFIHSQHPTRLSLFLRSNYILMQFLTNHGSFCSLCIQNEEDIITKNTLKCLQGRPNIWWLNALCSLEKDEWYQNPFPCHRFWSSASTQSGSQISFIKNILKWREESDTYLTQVHRHHWSRKISMKVDGAGASSQTLWLSSATTVMSTDVSQVGITLFPSF